MNRPNRKGYAIQEIFESIQGEGAYSGTSTLFIRFAGCNLDCPFCDTEWKSGRNMTLDEIATECMRAMGILPEGSQALPRVGGYLSLPDRITFTGGEPTLQLDLALISAVRSVFGAVGRHPFVSIETNGLRPIHPIHKAVNWVTCSPKYLDHNGTHRWEPLGIETINVDEIRLTVGPNDGITRESLQSFVSQFDLTQYFWLSPETVPNSAGKYAFVQEHLDRCVKLVRENPKWRVSLQSHKIIGVR